MTDRTTKDMSGVVHHHHTETVYVRVYDPSRDPWLPVRRLLTCPHCQAIAEHREVGNPQKEFDRLMQAGVGQPRQCGHCDTWSVLAQSVDYSKKHPAGLRVRCPDYLIPRRSDPQEER